MKNRLTIGYGIVAIFAMAFALATIPSTVSAQRKNAILALDQGLACDKTTEHGQDEVYMIVTVKTSDGREAKVRLPQDAAHREEGHWNMNDNQDDGDPVHRRRGIELANVALAPGQTADITVMIFEEDGGMPGGWMQLAGAVLTASKEPKAVVAGTVLGILGSLANKFNVRDTDDYIGSFGVFVKNESGKLTAEYRPLDRIASQIPNIHGANTHEFRMNGDGSNYVAWANVR